MYLFGHYTSDIGISKIVVFIHLPSYKLVSSTTTLIFSSIVLVDDIIIHDFHSRFRGRISSRC